MKKPKLKNRKSGASVRSSDFVRHLVEMVDRVVKDVYDRHRQISKGQLVYGDCYAVHHEHIYDLENALAKINAEMPNDQADRPAGRNSKTA